MPTKQPGQKIPHKYFLTEVVHKSAIAAGKNSNLCIEAKFM
jgi:hypothetical protein